MAVDKRKQTSESPMFIIEDALKIDTYSLRTQIQKALKNITFDLEIKDFNIKARAKPKEPEKDKDE